MLPLFLPRVASQIPVCRRIATTEPSGETTSWWGWRATICWRCCSTAGGSTSTPKTRARSGEEVKNRLVHDSRSGLAKLASSTAVAASGRSALCRSKHIRWPAASAGGGGRASAAGGGLSAARGLAVASSSATDSSAGSTAAGGSCAGNSCAGKGKLVPSSEYGSNSSSPASPIAAS